MTPIKRSINPSQNGRDEFNQASDNSTFSKAEGWRAVSSISLNISDHAQLPPTETLGECNRRVKILPNRPTLGGGGGSLH